LIAEIERLNDGLGEKNGWILKLNGELSKLAEKEREIEEGQL
jgi:hypothetical protein